MPASDRTLAYTWSREISVHEAKISIRASNIPAIGEETPMDAPEEEVEDNFLKSKLFLHENPKARHLGFSRI